jgi:hypothetical protein
MALYHDAPVAGRFGIEQRSVVGVPTTGQPWQLDLSRSFHCAALVSG